MELSDNSLNDILAFSMEDLFYVYFVNSLSEEKNPIKKDVLSQIIKFVNGYHYNQVQLS